MHSSQITQEQFDDIYIKYYRQLCLFVYKYVHDFQVSEDIVQDVFCQLLEKNQTIYEKTLNSFLFQCVKNGAINYINANEGRYDSIDELDVHTDRLIVEQSSCNFDYDRLLLVYNNILKTLPARTREIFEINRNGNMTNKQIAEHFGISVKAVEKHITKALSVLRKNMLPFEIIILMLLN